MLGSAVTAGHRSGAAEEVIWAKTHTMVHLLWYGARGQNLGEKDIFWRGWDRPFVMMLPGEDATGLQR